MVINGKQLIGTEESATGDADLRAVNPASGLEIEPAFYEASAAEVDQALRLAHAAGQVTREFSGEKLGSLCDAAAAKLEAIKDVLLARCGEETGYPDARLQGEFARTVNQLRMFAEVARRGDWLDARIDHADPGRQPLPKPDVRAINVPIGPVVVFGASNFPLALSAAGGDTASALAAGCPVVIKAHPSHPGTTELIGRAMIAAAKENGFPDGTVTVLQGASIEFGGSLVRHPLTRAVGFTGSLAGGRALCDIAAARPDPIPVYAEMGSINPQFVLPGKLSHDAEGFAEALFGSMTLGNGQFCTNPGLVFVAEGVDTDRFLAKLRELVSSGAESPVLSARVAAAYGAGLAALADLDGVEVTRAASEPAATAAAPAVGVTDLRRFQQSFGPMTEEVFGPSTLVVVCPAGTDFAGVASSLPGQLAASVHGSDADLASAGPLFSQLSRFAGRIIANGFPTGIEVCHAMHHGGPFPAASDSHFTSIGATAIRRWGRPACFQSLPDALLPPGLQEANPLGLTRLVDGVVTPGSAA